MRRIKTMSRKFMLSIISIFAILAFVLAAGGCGAVKSAQAFSQTGTDFMTDLKEAKYEAAYALFHQNLQSEVGSVAGLQKMIEDNKAQPKEWAFSSWNMSTDAEGNNTAKTEGTVTFQDDRKGTVALELVKVGEEWKLLSFSLNW
jgi:hypothetical protein